MQPSQLVAHRGHPARFPENSGIGIDDALSAGASWVEIDVQLSREGTPWLFHDDELARLSGRRGRVAELGDQEFAQLRVSEPRRLGDAFANEPALSLEAFAALLAKHPGARAFVEVKPLAVQTHGAARAFEEVVARLAPVRERVVLISFSFELLELARARCELPIAPILARWSQRTSEQLARLAPEYTFCNVEKLPRRGRIDEVPGALAVYEVVDPELARSLVARGAALVETFAIRDMLSALRASSGGAA